MSKILEEFPNIIILSDEVYDFLTFDGREFIRFASIGDNFQKTLNFYSGGKLFNATGWKVGWTVGPAHLIRLGAIIGNTIIYCVNLPAQQAMA
jgi:aspartate/methionine/tyrosine aminotransferase